MEIRFQDRALRNLVILAIIPFITLIWLSFLFGIYTFQQQIWPTYGMVKGLEVWIVFVVILLLVSIIQFFAIIYIRFNKEEKPSKGS